jgi:hypothetical protein
MDVVCRPQVRDPEQAEGRQHRGRIEARVDEGCGVLDPGITDLVVGRVEEAALALLAQRTDVLLGADPVAGHDALTPRSDSWHHPAGGGVHVDLDEGVIARDEAAVGGLQPGDHRHDGVLDVSMLRCSTLE